MFLRITLKIVPEYLHIQTHSQTDRQTQTHTHSIILYPSSLGPSLGTRICQTSGDSKMQLGLTATDLQHRPPAGCLLFDGYFLKFVESYGMGVALSRLTARAQQWFLGRCAVLQLSWAPNLRFVKDQSHPSGLWAICCYGDRLTRI